MYFSLNGASCSIFQELLRVGINLKEVKTIQHVHEAILTKNYNFSDSK